MSTPENTTGSTDSGTTQSQSAIGRRAGGLPVDANGKRVYPNDADNNNTIGGQTKGPRTYARGAGHYYGG